MNADEKSTNPYAAPKTSETPNKHPRWVYIVFWMLTLLCIFADYRWGSIRAVIEGQEAQEQLEEIKDALLEADHDPD